MADRVNANPNDIRKLATALAAYKKQVETASKQVQGALNAAHWHDPQKDKFEAHYKDLQRSINGFLNGEVEQMVKSLNQLAQKIAEIQAIRL